MEFNERSEMDRYNILNIGGYENWQAGVYADDVLATVEASDAITALDIYAQGEGFAGYTGTEMEDDVHVWKTDDDPLRSPIIASAPFTNYEIAAVLEA
jgi:hypothetical protein